MNQKKYEIYIGLNNQQLEKEVLSVDDFAQILSGICTKEKIGFSLTSQLGGYSHNQGFIIETSLRITLFGITEKEVNQLGDSLKKIVNTDTIMITSEDCSFSFR